MSGNLINRLNTSVEFLKDNLSFKVGGFVLGVVDSNTIFINAYSNYISLEQLSKTKAIQEFNELKNNFIASMEDAKTFQNYIKYKNIEYNLVLDTGGASVLICKEKKGELEVFI